ncbi:MAG TPA: T9SS type A sorting domain-containing protein [Bacteroidia bacterium]|nr:T9SS type A sorting domain-containing protein [Bacteroidia bacterium]
MIKNLPYSIKKLNIGLAAFVMALNCISFTAKSQLVTYTFTPAGATGRTGPTQAQVNAAYLSTNLNGSVTSNLGVQQFTIPIAGVYRIDTRGAQGASSGGAAGGLGAQMIGDFTFTVGTVLKIVVGQQGIGSSSGAGGGGGGSYVATFVGNTPLIVAGGGSGAADVSYPGTSAGTGSVGNPGGNCANAGPTGFGGGDASACGSGAGGAGGFYGDGSSGGSWGAQRGYGFVNGSAGGLSGSGGRDGGFGGGAGTHLNNTGGGAGGGYTGGGASYHGGTYVGGAGSSFNSGTTQTNTAAFNSADGKVLITRMCNINIYASGLNASGALCSGASATLTTDAISNYSWSTGSSAPSIIIAPTTNTVYTLTAMSPSNCITSNSFTVLVSTSAPVLTVTPSSNTVCLGNTVSINATGAITYTWSGGISNGVAFSPTATTSYSVIGQNGCGSVQAVSTISILPLPVIGIVSPTVVCVGNTATLTGGGATTYTWNPGNTVGTNFIVSPGSNTTYTVVGGTGNCIGTNTVALATNPIPTVAAAVSNSMICVGTSVTLTASGGLSYTWTPGGMTGSMVVVSPTGPTGYVVTGVNNFNCSSSANAAVVAFPSPTVNISTTNNSICVGGSATLTASGANTYVWTNGPAAPVNMVSPIANTTYTVVGTSSANNCSSSQTISIAVFEVTIAVSSPTSVCLGQSVTLNASGANSYLWNNGNTNPSIVVSPSVTSGYTVNGVSSIGGNTCISSGTTQVNVNPLPSVTASSTRTSICRGEHTTLSAAGANAYLWNTSATTTTISVNPLSTTNYTVTGTDNNNCINSATIQVKVSLCTGLEEKAVNTQNISVFPNPSKGEFSITGEQEAHLELVNSLGQVVLEIALKAENHYTLKVDHLNSGVYIIRSKDGSFRNHNKIIIEN